MKEARRHGPEGSSNIDVTRCRASVYHTIGVGGHFLQCRNRAIIDGQWCKLHRPGAQEARDAAASKRWQENQERAHRREINTGLAMASVEQLRAELQRRGEQP